MHQSMPSDDFTWVTSEHIQAHTWRPQLHKQGIQCAAAAAAAE